MDGRNFIRADMTSDDKACIDFDENMVIMIDNKRNITKCLFKGSNKSITFDMPYSEFVEKYIKAKKQADS